MLEPSTTDARRIAVRAQMLTLERPAPPGRRELDDLARCLWLRPVVGAPKVDTTSPTRGETP